jgi:hypothetical protein
VKYRGVGLAVVAAGFLLAAGAEASWSQEITVESRPFRACLLPTVDLSATEEYRDYQSIISEQLRVELENAGLEIIPRKEWDAARQRRGIPTGELYRASAALEVASQINAEIAVVSFYSVEDRQLALEVKCYDVAQRAVAAAVFKTARINLSVYNVITEAVTELVPAIRLIGPPPTIESPVVEQIALLSEDEGAEIYLGDEGFVGRITDGRLVLPPIPFAIGAKVSIEKRMEEYHNAAETVKLKEPQMTIKLEPLRKKAYAATELNWTLGQLLGFGLAQRFYLVPDSSYFSAEHYFYVQHNFSDSKPVFHHDLRVLFGGYLFAGPHSLLRFNLSTGFGLIVTYFALRDQPVYADYYWNLVNVAFELNFRKYIFYIRSEQKYTLGIGPDSLLGRGWLSVFGEGPTAFTLGLARKW